MGAISSRVRIPLPPPGISESAEGTCGNYLRSRIRKPERTKVSEAGSTVEPAGENR